MTPRSVRVSNSIDYAHVILPPICPSPAPLPVSHLRLTRRSLPMALQDRHHECAASCQGGDLTDCLGWLPASRGMASRKIAKHFWSLFHSLTIQMLSIQGGGR